MSATCAVSSAKTRRRPLARLPTKRASIAISACCCHFSTLNVHQQVNERWLPTTPRRHYRIHRYHQVASASPQQSGDHLGSSSREPHHVRPRDPRLTFFSNPNRSTLAMYLEVGLGVGQAGFDKSGTTCSQRHASHLVYSPLGLSRNLEVSCRMYLLHSLGLSPAPTPLEASRGVW